MCCRSIYGCGRACARSARFWAQRDRHRNRRTLLRDRREASIARSPPAGAARMIGARVILVPGTWHGEWSDPDSPFWTFLEAQRFRPLKFRGWSGDVDGLPHVIDPQKSEKLSDWIAGGWALFYLLRNLPYERRNVVAHSHGGQVALFAAGLARVQIHRLITVCTPVRKDMADIRKLAAPRIG